MPEGILVLSVAVGTVLRLVPGAVLSLVFPIAVLHIVPHVILGAVLRTVLSIVLGIVFRTVVLTIIFAVCHYDIPPVD